MTIVIHAYLLPILEFKSLTKFQKIYLLDIYWYRMSSILNISYYPKCGIKCMLYIIGIPLFIFSTRNCEDNVSYGRENPLEMFSAAEKWRELHPTTLKVNIPILPIGIDFCKQKLTAPPLRPMGYLVHCKLW